MSLQEGFSQSAYNTKQNHHVVIFSDSPERFSDIRDQVKIFSLKSLETFNLENCLSQWSSFQNSGEMMSSFESKQILIIFKKFVKSLVTSKPITSLDKLINLTQNLVKAHLNTLHHHKAKI
jgi:hypothetical protein